MLPAYAYGAMLLLATGVWCLLLWTSADHC